MPKNYRDKKISNHAETLLGHHFIEMKLKRKFCERIVVKEYPYSELDTFRLWGKLGQKKIFIEYLVEIFEKSFLNLICA